RRTPVIERLRAFWTRTRPAAWSLTRKPAGTRGWRRRTGSEYIGRSFGRRRAPACDRTAAAAGFHFRAPSRAVENRIGAAVPLLPHRVRRGRAPRGDRSARSGAGRAARQVRRL